MATEATTKTEPHQVYVTHCARTDSVLGTVGFSVRASSSPAQEVLKAAMEYPAYELPMEMWAKRPARADAPRRLARVRTAGEWLLVHTGYLEKDTMNRDRSYFTHAMLLPTAAPADVLESWNSYTWATDYPAGQSKTLPAPMGVPKGKAVSDAAVKDFLSTAGLAAGGGLAAAVWPERLRADAAARRELVGRVVRGVMAATADPASARGRLFIHAEPGLVALLLYAAVRLLPPGVTGDLTFTTYEPPHRALREFKRAVVVGTYTANPAKGLDPELASTHAYTVDTFAPSRSSRELQGPHPKWVEALLDLAAAGARKSVKAVHALCPTGKATAADIERAAALSAGLERLAAGAHTPDDLIALQTDPRGRGVVATAEAKLWPEVAALALTRADIRDAFRPWFAAPHRADEVFADGFAALARGDAPGWDARWRLLTSAVDRAGVGRGLARVLVERAADVRALPPAGRQKLRDGLAAVPDLPPDALGPLLTPTSPTELDQVCKDGRLPGWAAGYALFTARTSTDPALESRAKALLAAADARTVGGYARQTEPLFATRPDLADEIFDLKPDGSAPVLDRLLSTGGEYLSAARWGWAASRMKLFSGEAGTAALTRNGRLGMYLGAVGGQPAGEAAWAWALHQVGPDFLTPGTPAAAVWAELDRADALLAKAHVDPSAAQPPKLRDVRDAGRAIASAAGGAPPSPEQLRVAFARFGLNEEDGLRRVFERACGGRTPQSAPEAFDRFADLFGRMYPPSDTSFRPNNRALSVWLALASTAPPKLQRELHQMFFDDARLSPRAENQRLLLANSDELPHPLTPAVADAVRDESALPVVRPTPTPRTRGTKAANPGRVIAVVAAAVVVLVLVGWKLATRGDKAQAGNATTPEKKAPTPEPPAKAPATTPDAKKANPPKDDTKAVAAPPKTKDDQAKKDPPAPPKPSDAAVKLRALDDAIQTRIKDLTAVYGELLDTKPFPLAKADTDPVTGAISELSTRFSEQSALWDKLTPVEKQDDYFKKLPDRFKKSEDGWTARRNLVVLFTHEPYDSEPAVVDWFRNVHTEFSKLPDDDPQRVRVRAKVQQFCEAYIPRNLERGKTVKLYHWSYLEARDSIRQRGWSSSTFDRLFSDAVRDRDTHRWNKLSLPGAAGEFNVCKRLAVVSKAMADHQDLFPPDADPVQMGPPAPKFVPAPAVPLPNPTPNTPANKPTGASLPKSSNADGHAAAEWEEARCRA